MCLFSQIEEATNMMLDDLSDTSQNRSDDIVSGSGDLNERDQDKPRPSCCVSGNFTFHSIDEILNNISSNNTIVNIPTDVELSSIVTLEGLENIMITGHRNPVVKCNDVGAVKLISCKNITIEGIQWEGCGSKDYPGVEFYNSSNVSFERCLFHNSKGRSVLLSEVSGNVCINNCNFTYNNKYSRHGAAIHYLPNTNSHGQHNLVVQNSRFIFNRATQSVVYIDGSGSRIPGHVYLQDSEFVNNTGVPIYISHTNLHIRGGVLFKGNTAKSGGGIYSRNSTVIFCDKSDVNFINICATDNGGAIYQIYSSGADSVVTFTGNSARFGGAIYSDNSNIKFDGNSSVSFSNNKASYDGGAVFCDTKCAVLFYRGTLVKFINNSATTGGAIHSESNSCILSKGDSVVQFLENRAIQGGAIYSKKQVAFLLEGSCKISFNNSKASESGGALYITGHSTVTIAEHSKVIYSNNEGTQYGGAIYCSDNSSITLEGQAMVIFINNTSQYGGALSILQSTLIFDGNTSVNFTRNKAENGGAISVVKSSVTFVDSPQTEFFSNSARNGGAMHLSNHFTVSISHNAHNTFSYNTANHHGGAIYCDLTKSTENKITFNYTDVIMFYSNTDLIGSDVYIDMPTSCDETCLNDSIINIEHTQLDWVSIKTSPRKLEFNNSAVTCIDNDNDTICQTYLTRNIMLGQEITINACLWDYYNQPAGSTQFVLSSEDKDHHVIGPNNVLLSCTLFDGVSIMGNRVMEATNYTMNITSYDLKEFSIELITELSPCHSGFYYDNTTQMCVCYSDSDIVYCSGSTSSIKRGYWFGEVNDKATVAICPNSYCNFTCCETADGFFKLSPVRENQCNSQRSGTACGGCKKNFTLSFDSIECVSVDTCTTGQTVLVVTLSILYWVVIVILVFIVTYYHTGIGYLYAITYYYSVVDILLCEHLYISQGLFTVVSIMSSIAKVTPQFLGQFCLVTNMSGIDQQFIHYVHPLAVAIIIVVICLSARISVKFSSFVSRGIIHVICFLLLLSYTSVATTSLLLMRFLTFYNVDKVYTHLSPDIEYLHGRHLPYFILAIVCALIIVIGLPFLLLFEPFLNYKISFTKIKPLLDQFQGCYKDKYRSFAAYYMACRLVTILIIIVNPSNDDTSRYLLIILNSCLAFIHATIKPYRSNILNVFDSFVLHLMIVVSMVPLIDSYDPNLLLSFIFVLVILPLISFLLMEIYLYKRKIKKIANCFVPPKHDTTNDNNEVPMRDFVDSIIDDSRRVNTTICEIYSRESETDDVTHYRESFFEVMDEIKD
ncbi:uncharacterized protein [Dysidea avara]|uniref:uncharacterized protein isoform X2 n=1 Tax=Dysidea avara TaxID=196820 RepID=UPI00331E5ADF